MFVYQNHSSFMILHSSHLKAFIRTLGTEFHIKDLGRLHYFLAVEVHYHPASFHLTQNKYTIDLLKSSNLLDCKPVSTPMASKGTLFQNLWYCPCGSYSLSTDGRRFTISHHNVHFMGSPSDVHFEAVKWSWPSYSQVP
ncbi:hypothetical protein L3X38_026262 [Prunus dulcis]|uniref:Reverse transcriptase Ty1/copia-type domain-containing protein n=1 Tax=Prunus dulcis TaxID=3755 RepID=A0AAD4Z8S8_PRUDU|nr:hypothetical protein L3X38_026262 [Prunus dulcis]